jgi:hypothetical protein
MRAPEVRAVRGPRWFALPKGRIAQLVDGKVRVLGHDLREQTIVAPDGARALAALSDGALLVVGGRETCILAPESGVSWCFPKLTIGAELTWAWGDARAPRRFWLMEGSFVGENELPPAAGAKVKPLGEFEAPEDAVPFGDGRVATLGAGAIVFNWRSGVRRVALPEGMRIAHLVAIGDDAAWASDGATLLRLDLSGETAAVKQRVGAAGTIVSLDADADHVATLIAEGAPGEPPRWSVAVRGAGGELRWRAATPFQPAVNEQGHLAVALGRFDPLVAVGDERRLAVWDVRDGRSRQQAT